MSRKLVKKKFVFLFTFRYHQRKAISPTHKLSSKMADWHADKSKVPCCYLLFPINGQENEVVNKRVFLVLGSAGVPPSGGSMNRAAHHCTPAQYLHENNTLQKVPLKP